MTPSPLRPTVTAPPRGWNSWDCFGGSVREDEVIANAEHMARHLLPQGWDTIVVDIQWYEPEPGSTDYAEVSAALVDEVGRPLPAPGRFPSAADGAGFAPLAERIHALGLRFGVHLMRGIPRRAVELDTPILGTDATARDLADPDNRCPWNPDFEGVHADHPAAQAWYDSVFALLAQWGVDYVKVDDVLYPPIQRADIAMMRTAIDRSGRPMLLSLSPGKELSAVHAPFLAASADAWRVSDDLWDTWDDLREQFQRAARWAAVDHEGGFADLDMLPLGRIGIRAHVGEDRISRLTAAEQRTMLTLWNLGRSPLMMGGHLPDTPAETSATVTSSCGGCAWASVRSGRSSGWGSGPSSAASTPRTSTCPWALPATSCGPAPRSPRTTAGTTSPSSPTAASSSPSPEADGPGRVVLLARLRPMSREGLVLPVV
ncbi:alpha-galactosidase [Brachybacterium phenoliresistens]|uniref:Alpha-galactosidase n=1 Tax=Brachybacterium phenoliresistens TaxID=396014 RepID=Z9JNX6_9MICO|nr:glycoside hydrolase family 27 protein [Brachybacterium phenoliresistens]EWS79491.1 alpha-galactosidase [Brachybacterium phenoliresistens]